MRGAIQRRAGEQAGRLLAVAAIAAGLVGWASPAAARAQADQRPNVIVIMSDDQALVDMHAMPRTTRLIGERGATFAVSVTNWPLCCPSRATFLTGQYAGNHGVRGNEAPHGGFDRLRGRETLAVWLRRAGYHTAHIGKTLNGYEESPVGVPPGWSEWRGSKVTHAFYGYELLEGGQRVRYGSIDENPDDPSDPSLYQTDVFTDKAVELIERRAELRRPFFLSLNYTAPHGGWPVSPPGEPPYRCEGGPKPAPRHLGALDGTALPRPPSFNADVSGKPPSVAGLPPLSADQIAEIERAYRCRGESLLAVDEGIERIVRALVRTRQLPNTLIIFTSDHGFFYGEHRIPDGKNRVYEPAIRVPLLIRGPGVRRGVTVHEPTINADLAPTILAATGAEPGLRQDGRGLLRTTREPRKRSGRELLIESRTYAAIRNERYMLVTYQAGPNRGSRELYDLRADPHQLTNQARSRDYAAARRALVGRLRKLRRCAGASCSRRPALRLRLPAAVRRNGRRCRLAGRLIVRVEGAAARRAERVTVRVGGRLASRRQVRPLQHRIKPRLVRGRRVAAVRVNVELIDGRRADLDRRIHLCR